MSDIVVGVDQSETARRAAEKAATLAAELGCTLHVVNCVKGEAPRDVGVGSDRVHLDTDIEAEAYLKSLVKALPHDDVKTHVAHGDPADVMCDVARRLDARMLVVGNRRVQGAARMLGSVSAQVARHAPCDVLVAHTVVK